MPYRDTDEILLFFFGSLQSCHHGGHARHVSDWFKTHVRCPAFRCGCKCAALDPGTRLAKLSMKNKDTDDFDELQALPPGTAPTIPAAAAYAGGVVYAAPGPPKNPSSPKEANGGQPSD